jgi:D-proline reductase (dithiol) PrdB
MVRLSDLPDIDAQHLRDKECLPFATSPFASGPPLSERRLAIVTTAGLHRKSDTSFQIVDAGYRVIPGDISSSDLTMSHSSVNFDRTGFQQDINVVFPIDRLNELDEAGEIGSVARFHYSLMGARILPEDIEKTCRTLASFLKEDQVNAVLLVPV